MKNKITNSRIKNTLIFIRNKKFKYILYNLLLTLCTTD